MTKPTNTSEQLAALRDFRNSPGMCDVPRELADELDALSVGPKLGEEAAWSKRATAAMAEAQPHVGTRDQLYATIEGLQQKAAELLESVLDEDLRDELRAFVGIERDAQPRQVELLQDAIVAAQALIAEAQRSMQSASEAALAKLVQRFAPQR